MARLLLTERHPNKYEHLYFGRLKKGESKELSADAAVGFLGLSTWEVTLSEEEINGLSDKKLATAQRLLGLGSKEETLKHLLPEPEPKTVVQKVTSAVNSVKPTLNKKVIKEETSDEAVLADDSE